MRQSRRPCARTPRSPSRRSSATNSERATRPLDSPPGPADLRKGGRHPPTPYENRCGTPTGRGLEPGAPACEKCPRVMHCTRLLHTPAAHACCTCLLHMPDALCTPVATVHGCAGAGCLLRSPIGVSHRMSSLRSPTGVCPMGCRTWPGPRTRGGARAGRRPASGAGPWVAGRAPARSGLRTETKEMKTVLCLHCHLFGAACERKPKR